MFQMKNLLQNHRRCAGVYNTTYDYSELPMYLAVPQKTAGGEHTLQQTRF